MLKGFRDFIARGNAVDLAVGLVIGVAFGAVVNAIVDGVINPLIAAIFGKPTSRDVLTSTLNDAGHLRSDDTVLSFGSCSTRFDFVLVAAAIYFFVVVPLNALAARRAKDEPALDEAASPTEIELLTEIRDALRK